MRRLTTAHALAVPRPAPKTPQRGMKSALKKTSSTHITAFRTLGETISPALCRNEAHSELSCENGTMSANVRKYAHASARIASSPWSQRGSGSLISAASAARIAAISIPVTRPCRTMVRAPRSSPPPMRCDACTEKPAETPPMIPPISHVLVDTSPRDAEAFAPSAPTIAESMYCMAIVVICVSIAGRLNRQTSRACAFSSGIVSLFISSSGPRRFY